MTDGSLARRITGHVLFALLCLFLLATRLLPLNTMPGGWPGPDLMLCLVLAWTVRRPEDVPLWLVVSLFLIADLLLMRPPGLWTALVVLAVEALRRRHARARATPLLLELAGIAALILVLSVANWLILALTFVDQPGLAAHLPHAGVTILAYPLVIAVLHFALGIRKRPAPEGFGRRVSA